MELLVKLHTFTGLQVGRSCPLMTLPALETITKER